MRKLTPGGRSNSCWLGSRRSRRNATIQEVHTPTTRLAQSPDQLPLLLAVACRKVRAHPRALAFPLHAKPIARSPTPCSQSTMPRPSQHLAQRATSPAAVGQPSTGQTGQVALVRPGGGRVAPGRAKRWPHAAASLGRGGRPGSQPSSRGAGRGEIWGYSRPGPGRGRPSSSCQPTRARAGRRASPRG